MIDYCAPPADKEWHESAPSWVKEECIELDKERRLTLDLAAALALEPKVVARPIDTQYSLAERFREQAEKWERETAHLSSPNQLMMHPSYQAILGMARDHEHEIVSLLIRDMQQNERPWFAALSYLTKENPIERKDAGDMDKMIASWVRWGKGKDIL